MIKNISLFALLALLASAALGAEPVTVGTGTLKFNGLVQAWWLNDTTAQLNNFRLRRAELKFNGSVVESTRWFVMIDPAKSIRIGTTGTLSSANDNKVLSDLGIVHEISKELEFMVGQFKTQTSAYGLDSSGELLFAERSLTARTYGDKREPGALLQYKNDLVKVGAMVSNGQASNVDDTNGAKTMNLRIEATPHETLKAGFFTQAGDFNYGKTSVFGAHARFTTADLLVRSEYDWGYSSGVKTAGWVLDASYTVMSQFQPVARFETVDFSGVFTGRQYVVGLNWLQLKHNSKVQLNWSFLDGMTGSNGSPALTSGTKGTLMTVAFQAAI